MGLIRLLPVFRRTVKRWSRRRDSYLGCRLARRAREVLRALSTVDLSGHTLGVASAGRRSCAMSIELVAIVGLCAWSIPYTAFMQVIPQCALEITMERATAPASYCAGTRRARSAIVVARHLGAPEARCAALGGDVCGTGVCNDSVRANQPCGR